MVRKSFLALFAVLAAAASVNAGVIGIATQVKSPPGNPFNAPDAALPSPWVAYQLSLQTTAGEMIQAVDVVFEGNKLHQRWNDTDFDGTTNPSPNGAPSNGRGDSHLTAPAGSPFGFGPTETNTLAGSPLPSVPGTTEYGLGNLAGAWALPTAAANTNLAYIVFNAQDATNGIPNFQLTVKSADPTGAQFNGGIPLTAADFFIPEPATFTLIGLALAGLGFIRRR